MAFKTWNLIELTLFSSCFSFICYVISISTDSWITATAVLTNQIQSDVNYGLFSGKIERHQLAATLRFGLSVTCDFTENACIYSCQRNGNERQDELNRILRDEELLTCEETSRNIVDRSEHNARNLTHSAKINIVNRGKQCMPASLWLNTVFFLTLSILLTVTAGIFEMINLHFSPVEPIFNVFGLFFWNGAAAICSLLTLSFWGGLFNNFLSSNIAITDTLRHELTFLSNGLARIGYSLFMVLAGLLLNICNVALLFLRHHLVNRHAEPHTITVAQNGAPLQFY